MPMKYKTTKSKSKPHKKWYDKKYSVAQIASKAYRIATKIASAVNSEKKHYDTYTSTSVTTTWSVLPLTEIAQGDGETTRDGHSIALKSLQVDPMIDWYDASHKDQSVRMMLVRTKENMAGNDPVETEILNLTSANPFIAQRNMNFTDRYEVLQDNVYTRDQQVVKMFPSRYFKKFFNKKDYKGDKTIASHITWTSDQAGDTDQGHIYMMMVSNYDTENPVVKLCSRIRFYDN